MGWRNPRWNSLRGPDAEDLRAIIESLQAWTDNPTFEKGIHLGKADGTDGNYVYDVAKNVRIKPSLPLIGNDNITAMLADLSVTTAKLADLAVTNAKLADNAVSQAKLQDAIVSNQKLVDGAVNAVKIATSAITTTKIADDAITTPKIVAGAVQAAQLDALAVTAGKIAAGAVATTELAAGSVTAIKIGAGEVVAGKLATDAVAANNILAGAVVAGKIAADAVAAAEIAAYVMGVGKYIRSQGYVPGSAGWAIDASGTAEFSNVIVRGTVDASVIQGSTFTTGAVGSGLRIVMSASAADEIRFFTGSGAEVQAGFLQVGAGTLSLQAPHMSGSDPGYIQMLSDTLVLGVVSNNLVAGPSNTTFSKDIILSGSAKISGPAGGAAAPLNTRSGGHVVTFDWDYPYLYFYVDSLNIGALTFGHVV